MNRGNSRNRASGQSLSYDEWSKREESRIAEALKAGGNPDGWYPVRMVIKTYPHYSDIEVTIDPPKLAEHEQAREFATHVFDTCTIIHWQVFARRY